MVANPKYLQRFDELAAEAPQLRRRRDEYGVTYVEGEDWQRWATSVLNLLKQVGSEDSVHYRNFDAAYHGFQEYESGLQKAYGIFASAKNDYKNGLMHSLETSVSGEVFADLVGAAKAALTQGNKDVAAVLACAALEDALKKFAKANSLSVDGKDMTEVIGALKAKGLVGGAQKSILETMPKTRNNAMHADWSKISPTEVGGVIGFTEQFLLQNF